MIYQTADLKCNHCGHYIRVPMLKLASIMNEAAEILDNKSEVEELGGNIELICYSFELICYSCDKLSTYRFKIKHSRKYIILFEPDIKDFDISIKLGD